VSERKHEGERVVRLDHVVGLLLAVAALWFGIEPLYDNSFFTHLATGRLILADGAIPSADPYSFTAFGTPWTVQSWGASVIYAGTEELVGLVGIRVLVGVICAVLALLVWRLTEPADGLVGRLAIALPVVAIGSNLWVERPLIFSLLFLLGILFALEGRLAAVWVAPILWAWVNIHGSYPIGLVAIGCFGLGRLLDRERPEREARILGWAVIGTVLGGLLSPVGPRLLTFPFQLLGRREAFGAIVEWQSPQWQDAGEVLFALQLLLAVVLIAWRGRRWHHVVPVVVFAALSLQSTRNIVHASVIFIPAMAASARGLGSIDARQGLPVLRPVRAAVVALGLVVFGVGVAQPDTQLGDYPVEAVAWMRANDLLELDDRVVSRDFVGNYLHVRHGPEEVRVYIDDRVDMYPIELIADYTTLIDPDGDYAPVLARAEATAVLWDTESPFGDWLADPQNGWVIVQETDGWVVGVPGVDR
jgi:hypothetical protein